ncbi:MAG TPA: hypothetical protein VF201_10215 [Nitrolancea sp.]
MTDSGWSLSNDERATLGRALDALLPPSGSFPAPSQTGLIDGFILQRVPESDPDGRLYPALDAPALRRLLAGLEGAEDMTAALADLERSEPAAFTALWRLAVYGYYAQPETITAIQRDLAPAYHGAPMPLGYVHAMAPWDANDPLQMPRQPRGSFIPTDKVKRAEAPWLRERDGER